jgi:enediyne biosynthesis protein E4
VPEPTAVMKVTSATDVTRHQYLIRTWIADFQSAEENHRDCISTKVACQETMSRERKASLLDWPGPFCSYRGLSVYCGPRGLTGQRDLLYHNNKDGTFTEVGVQLGIDPKQYYGLGVIWGDYDNDGRLDLYIANDSTASLLYHNVTPTGGPARFEEIALPAGVAYSPDGHEQSGMGVDFGDYDAGGWMDLIKTNFSDDAPNVYHNNRDGTFTDLTFESGLGEVSRTSLGFGIAFADLENSGVLDIVVANGHVNP